MNEQYTACAFTGNRNIGKDFSAGLMLTHIETVIKKGVTVFYSGVARGFDLLAAEAILMFKGKYPQIKLIACVPHIGQEQWYTEEEKARYYSVLKRADEVITLSKTYYNGCMQKRNVYMVDRSDVIIAYNREEKGGTVNTLSYCNKKYPEKEILYV